MGNNKRGMLAGICRRIISTLVLPVYTVGLMLVFQVTSCKNRAISELKTDSGVEITESHPIFYSLVRLKNQDNPNWSCTGTLIARKLVVTAAHCLEGKNLAKILLKIGDEQFKVGQALTFRERPHLLSMNFDVAWIELDRDTPEQYSPVPVLRDVSKVSDTELLLAGFERGADDKWKKTGASHKLIEFIHKPHIRSIMILGKTGSASGTPGDSGGPSYVEINGKWYLVGITHGIHPVMALSRDEYHVLSTFAGHYFDWLEKTAGRTISYLGDSNPAMVMQNSEPKNLATNFDEACSSWNQDDPNWLAIQKLADQAAYFTYSSENYSHKQARDSLLNCTAMKTQLLAEIEAEEGDLNIEPFVRSFEKKDAFSFPSFEILNFSSNIRELQLYSAIFPSFKGLCTRSDMKALFLRKHPAVSSLDIVGDIDPTFLKECKNLRKLWIEGFNLRDLSPLSTLHSLENFAGSVLNVSQVQLPDNFSSLKSLILINSGITDISDISRLKRLESLNLDGNKIVDLRPLVPLTKLRELSLTGNPIKTCPKNVGSKVLREFCAKL